METLILDEVFVENLSNYIYSQDYAIGTKIVYINNLKKIAKEYKTINRDNLLKLHKKLKHPFQRAIFKIINDYCFIKKIEFKVTLPSIKKSVRKVPDVFSLNEIRIMIDATPEKYKLLVRSIFGFGAGLRISEGIGIAWHRFDWNDWLYKENDNMELDRIRKTESELDNGIYTITSTKRNKTYPITVPRKLMVDYYKLAIKIDILNEFGVPSIKEPVFDFGLSSFNPNLREDTPVVWKNKYTKHAYDWFRYNLVEKIFNVALNKKIKIHSLRHSRASYLLEQGVPLEEISKLLGHEDIKTSMIYTRITLGKIKKSMKNIDTI